MQKMTSIKKARTEWGNRRVLFSAIFITVLLLLVVGQILADDVLLLLPKNFDVVAQRGWYRHKDTGYEELTPSKASQTILQFRGNKVTAGMPRTDRYPSPEGGVTIIKGETKLVATYVKGHLSGTYESSQRNWNEGFKDRNNGEYLRQYYKGTFTGEANADGILKITVQITEDTTLDNDGGGWKKRNQEPNLFSWGAEFKLPVGELQSSQKFISDGKKSGEQTQGEETPSSPDSRISGSDQSSSSQEGPDPVTPGEAAAGAGVVGAIAAVGAWLTMLSSGVRPKDVMEALGGLFGTGPPPEPVTEPPVEPPRILFQEPPVAEPLAKPPHSDGDVNERDEVWSAEINGWLGRNEYEKDRARRTDIERINQENLQSPTAGLKEDYDKWQASKKKLEGIRKAGLAQEADWARDDLQHLFEKEQQKGPISDDRAILFANIWNKIQDAQESDDVSSGLEDLQTIGNVIQGQGRASYEPKYTTRDLVEDMTMRAGATVLDLGGGCGYANAAISFIQGSRETIRYGGDTSTALMQGSKNALLEIAIFKVGAVGEHMGFDPLKVIAATTGATRGAMSMRDALERGDTLINATTKGFFDGAANATMTYGLGKAMEKPSLKVQDTIWGSARAPVIGAPEDPHIADQLARAKQNISVGSDGRKYMDLDDAMRLQQQTPVTRTMKQGLADPEVTEAFNNTMNNLKKTHDGVLVDKIKAKYPELADKEIRVDDFHTPSNKDPNPGHVDRDARVLVKNDKGKEVELDRSKWKDLSRETFSEVTGHAENPDRFRAGLTSQERAHYDSLNESGKLKFYQDKHQWKPMDKSNIEASRDYSDQRITATGERTQISKDEIGINRVKRGEATIEDPEGLGLMARTKISGEIQNNNLPESFAQAKKEVDTLELGRAGVGAQDRNVGKLPENMKRSMDLIKTYGDAAARNPEVANQLESAIQQNGFRDMNDFSDKLGSQIGSLKYAPKKP